MDNFTIKNNSIDLDLEFGQGSLLQQCLNAYYDCYGGGTKKELAFAFMGLGFEEDDVVLVIMKIGMELAFNDRYYSSEQAVELVESVRLDRGNLEVMFGIE